MDSGSRSGPELRLMPFILGGTKLRVGVLWLLGAAGIVLSLVLPNEVGRLTELFSGSGEVTWAPVQRALVLLVGAQLALSAVSYVRKSSEAVLQERTIRGFSLAVFDRTVRYPADFFRAHGVARIIQHALQDTQIVVQFSLDVLVGLPIAALSVVGFGAYMVYHHAFLGLCMIPLSLLTGYFVFFDRLIQEWNRKWMEAWDRVREEAGELLTCISEIRSHAAFEHGLAGLRQSFADHRQPALRVGRLTALFHAINPFVLSLQTGALYGLGAALCMRGSALAGLAGPTTWGDVIRFALVAALFQRPMLELANFFLRWRMCRENVRRLREHLDTPCVLAAREGDPVVPLSKGEIGFEDVKVVLPSGARILGTVDLTIQDGTHVGLAGLAGCGKSTLISLIAREREVTSGRLRLGDRDARDVSLLALAREVGYVPQKPVLFNASIRENILFGLRRRSPGAIRDDRGPLDVGSLPGAKEVGDVDRELVRVVRRVGLEPDLFQLFLDRPLRESPALRPVRERIGALRASVREALRGGIGRGLVRFDRGALMPGTVADSLLGPERAGEKGLSDCLDAVQAGLRGAAVYETLLRVGFFLFLSERALAVRVGQHAPQLLAYLPSQDVVDERDAIALAESKGALLGTLPPRQQQALLEVALRCDLDRAGEIRAGGELGRQILEARGRLHPAPFPWPASWSPCDEAPFVPALTARENLLWGRLNPRVIESAGKTDAALRDVLAGAGHLEAALLAGMESPAGDGGKNLSGGQRQKVAVARAVIKRPRVLILDEATSSLDEQSQARVVDLIQEEFRDRTVVSITHRLSMLRDFDQVVVMDRGKVVQSGPYETLAQQAGLFRDLLEQGGRARAVPAAGAPAADKDGIADAGDDVRRLLARCPLFGHLGSDQLGFVEKVSRRVECAPGEVLFRRGDPGTDLFIILEGDIEFYLERAGAEGRRDEIVTAYGPGQAFGELALFGDGTRTLSARARTPSVLCRVGRDDLLGLIAADPQIAVGLLRGLSRRMIGITDAQARSGPPGEGAASPG